VGESAAGDMPVRMWHVAGSCGANQYKRKLQATGVRERERERERERWGRGGGGNNIHNLREH
jgi:hypothetical protein